MHTSSSIAIARQQVKWTLLLLIAFFTIWFGGYPLTASFLWSGLMLINLLKMVILAMRPKKQVKRDWSIQ